MTSAQAQQTLSLPRLNGAIVLDGHGEEAAWQSITPLPVTMYEPVYQGTLTEHTEIRMGYDTGHIYVFASLYDSTPSGIRSNSLYRDRFSGDDIFGLVLDTFNDYENALWFWTTPAGVRGDQAISSDGSSLNDSWNTYWDVATQQNEEGWFVEMRIPFSSLGFQTQTGQITMGLVAYRYIARKNERHTYPMLLQDRAFYVPSRAQRITLHTVNSQKPLYVTPYVVGGLGQNAVLNTTQTRYHTNETSTEELGLDLKYNLTPNLTLDATLNTDFAQVEADDQQVNLTRFSLFFPEKRQFFQERSGMFSFGTGTFSSDRLFHSRRIGLRDGQTVPIIGGARLVGRIGNWDLGMLNMHTARQGGLPSENVGVLRLRKQVFNPNSYVGSMLTTRLGDDGTYNIAYGLDGTVRWVGDDYVTLKWAQTLDDTADFDFIDASVLNVQFFNRTQEGHFYWAALTRSGATHQPDLGFITRRDYTQIGWYTSYDWILGEGTPIRSVHPFQLTGFVAFRNADRTVESALVEYDTDLNWKSGAGIWLDIEWYYEDLRSPLRFTSTTEVPIGDYRYFGFEGGLDSAPGRLFRIEVDGGFSSFYDGWRSKGEIGYVWNASKHLELSSEYEFNAIRFPDRDQGFDAHLARLRMQGALNTHVSLNAFLQYNSVSRRVTTNLRFRYNFREGNDLWIVYNEDLNTERDRLFPTLPRSQERTLLLKYTYTFRVQ